MNLIMLWNTNTDAGENEQLNFTVPETKDIPWEDRDPEFYREVSGDRYYRHLTAHGDYSKLKLIVRSNRKEYYRERPVYVNFWVRNDSDGVVHLFNQSMECIFLWKLVHSQQGKVSYTSLGEERILPYKKNPPLKISPGGGGKGYRFRKLKPGEEMELRGQVNLNRYFDISLPGEYQLICPLLNLIDRQRYDPSLQSNTLVFRILDQPVPESEKENMATEDEILHHHYWDLKFTNPPRGEEIFEQKKEPKNIFYIFKNGKEIESEVSPYIYNQQRAEAEKRETKKFKPQEQDKGTK
ncbi:MAG: hypothetical protein LBC20_06510 [Planctomycetaceae bacterium]|jgi:hypothetical protein|nr:hypothetical protein [Planctomycetaceae bacterium]